jgi:hypothetical protein
MIDVNRKLLGPRRKVVDVELSNSAEQSAAPANAAAATAEIVSASRFMSQPPGA